MSGATGTRAASPVRLHKKLSRIWGTPSGLGRLSAVNHNILGKRFMVVALGFFTVGGLLAMLIRAQLATHESGFVGPDLYSQLFTMHGTVMMFLFAIPMLEGFAIYMLPKMLGSRDLAFPRLTAYGFWCYLFGGLILLIALLSGFGATSGWFMYTPLSSGTYSPGINADVWLIGVTLVEVSALTAAVEIIVTILKMRAPGMSLDRMPIFAWYMLVTAGMMLIGFPPLILGSVLLELERAFDLPFFDPQRGGDSLLWQHLFWLFGHPEVYIIFLPAAGVLSTIIPVFAGRPLAGYRLVVVAIVALGFLSFGLWVHHMFTTGIPHVALGFFSIASALVAIPTAVQIFAWIATLAYGKPRLSVPMLYVAGFFFTFVLGGLTGVMVAMVPFDTQAHDTHFVVAHLHYVLIGGFVFPMLAGIYHWLPHITGRLSEHRLSIPAFWLTFIGMNLTFLQMHVTGLMGMPRRISTYPSNFGWDVLNLSSSIGAFVLASGLALILVDIYLQFRFGRRRARDPWRAGTLEWATATPPPPYNFAALPAVEARADNVDPAAVGRRLAGGDGFLAFARENRQEALGVDVVTGEIEHIIVLPKRSFLPLWSALATTGAFLAVLFRLYWLAPLLLSLMVLLFFIWPRALGGRTDRGALDAGRGVAVPEDSEIKGNVTWWANLMAAAGSAGIFGAMLFGALFLATVAPGWPPGRVLDMSPIYALLPVAAIAAASGLAWWAGHRNANGEGPAGLLVAGAAAALLCALALVPLVLALPDPTEHASLAVSLVLILYAGLHVALAALIALHAWLRNRQGFVSAARATDIRLAAIWSAYAAVVTLVALTTVFVLAMIGRMP